MSRIPHSLSPSQRSLLDLLRAGNPRRDPSWKRNKYEFVLEYGWWYEPSKRPKGLKLGPPSRCFKNAFCLALDDNALTYCEGFVLSAGGGVLIHHAWVTDGQGHAIDNTLRATDGIYAGVPFNTSFVNRYHLRNKAITCLLDDYLHDWPLLRELGDRPGEWLEANGRGAASLAIPTDKSE